MRKMTLLWRFLCLVLILKAECFKPENETATESENETETKTLRESKGKLFTPYVQSTHMVE